jgi:hypothetical protein
MKTLLSFVPVTLLSFVVAAHLMAQGTEPMPTPAARLDQLDSTYATNLRLYHAPVILDYLRELEKLRQSFVTQGRDKDAARVLSEIEKTKKLSVSTGLLSYDPLKPQEEKSAKDKPSPSGKERHFSPDAITLGGELATNVSPPVDAIKQLPNFKALPIGHAEWHVDKIPAGIYELMLICSMTDDSAKTSVQATLGTLTAERKLPPKAGSGGINDARVFRVGTFTLDQDLLNTTLTLESSNPTHPSLWVRNLVLTHPKPPPGERGPGGPKGPNGPGGSNGPMQDGKPPPPPGNGKGPPPDGAGSPPGKGPPPP